MTLTVRSATVTGATTKGSALTHAEMDANWAHVIESSNHNFTQSGSDPVTQSSQDKARKVIHASDYTGYDATGATDSKTAITNAIAAAVAAGYKTVRVHGSPIVNSAIAISSNVKIVGDGKFTTNITRNFSGSSNDDGIFKVTGGADLELQGMTLKSASGVSAGCLISFVADANNAPSFSFRDVNLTTAGTDTHAYTLYVDGSLKTSGSAGIRDCALVNVDVFGAATKAALLKSVVNLTWTGGGVFSSGGSSGAIELTGTASVSSQNVVMNLASIAALDLEYTDNAVIKAGNCGAVTNTSNVTDVVLQAGNFSSTIETDWLRSWAFGPDGIRFPATQNASSNVNTLDDYEEGTWTPAISFATPGDFAVTYTTQVGDYTKIGNRVELSFRILTSSFTHTTASGNLRNTGVPFLAANATANYVGAVSWRGITKANYTEVKPYVSANSQVIGLRASGSAQATSDVGAADMPTGGTVLLEGSITYRASA
jgi:hypothetical protein